jgi:hypothetical protein
VQKYEEDWTNLLHSSGHYAGRRAGTDGVTPQNPKSGFNIFFSKKKTKIKYLLMEDST